MRLKLNPVMMLRGDIVSEHCKVETVIQALASQILTLRTGKNAIPRSRSAAAHLTSHCELPHHEPKSVSPLSRSQPQELYSNNLTNTWDWPARNRCWVRETNGPPSSPLPNSSESGRVSQVSFQGSQLSILKEMREFTVPHPDFILLFATKIVSGRPAKRNFKFRNAVGVTLVQRALVESSSKLI